MSKIFLKHIHIHTFWAQGDYEHDIILFHRNINRRENKAQIHLIIITMRKPKEYISDVQQKIIELHKLVALRKEPELWKLPFPPSEQ